MDNNNFSNFLSNWLKNNNCERLTAEEEKILPQKIQKMQKLKKTLKKEERAATIEEEEILDEGKKAFNKVIESNIPLGIHFAQKYARHYPGISLTVDDLTQEASIGIMHAANKYDPSRKCKFSTYAAYWIGQTIRRAIEDKGDIIRKPASAHSRARLVHKIDAQFNAHLDSEIMSELSGLTKEEVEFIRYLDKTQVTSIDQNFFSDDDDEQSFHEMIPDNTDVQGEIANTIEREKLMKLIAKIENEEDRLIEGLRLGFIGKVGPLSSTQISVILKGKLSPSEIDKKIEKIEREHFIFSEAISQSEALWMSIAHG